MPDAPQGDRRGGACPRPCRRTGSVRCTTLRGWTALACALAPVLLAGCAVKPAALAENPGDYEAFVREIMAEAARTDTTLKPAARPAQAAGDWLGTGGESSGESPLGGL